MAVENWAAVGCVRDEVARRVLSGAAVERRALRRRVEFDRRIRHVIHHAQHFWRVCKLNILGFIRAKNAHEAIKLAQIAQMTIIDSEGRIATFEQGDDAACA